MLKYLDGYKDGELPKLAESIGDGGQYINSLKKKFDAGEANWVWKKETVNQQIDAVILEYQITAMTGALLGSCKSYMEALKAWNEKINNIKLAYETIKNDVGDLLPLLAVLKELKQQGQLPENKKVEFLELLQNYGESFNKFYTSQFELFCTSCEFYLQNLNDADREKVFGRMQSGCFTSDNASYNKKVEEVVNQYRKELGSIRLKNIWKEKTQTDSPRKWSEVNKMPILAMIPDDELVDCRRIFGILSSPNPTDKDVNIALTYLESFTHWSELNDEAAKDNAFKARFLEDKSVLLQNISEVKEYVESHVSDSPYNWMENPNVTKAIDRFADAEYSSVGCDLAIQKIDSMNPEDVKRYLKELIKNNMKVGLQIIINN